MSTPSYSKKERIDRKEIGDQLVKNSYGDIKINLLLNNFLKALELSKEAWGLDHFTQRHIDRKISYAEKAINLDPSDERDFVDPGGVSDAAMCRERALQWARGRFFPCRALHEMLTTIRVRHYVASLRIVLEPQRSTLRKATDGGLPFNLRKENRLAARSTRSSPHQSPKTQVPIHRETVVRVSGGTLSK